MRSLALLAVLAVAAPLLAGCHHYHHVVYHDAVVAGPVIHHHGTGCGHVYLDGCWVEPRVTVVHTYRECGPRVIVAPVPHHFWEFGPHRLFHHHR